MRSAKCAEYSSIVRLVAVRGSVLDLPRYGRQPRRSPFTRRPTASLANVTRSRSSMSRESVSRTNASSNRFWTCQRSGAMPRRCAGGQQQLRPRRDLGQVGVGTDLVERQRERFGQPLFQQPALGMVAPRPPPLAQLIDRVQRATSPLARRPIASAR